MSVDFDNQIVSCDANAPKDRQLASDFADQNKGFSISAMDTNKGSSLMFENSEQMNTYLSNPPTDGVKIALDYTIAFTESDVFSTSLDCASSYYGFLEDGFKSTSLGLLGLANSGRVMYQGSRNGNPVSGTQWFEIGVGVVGLFLPEIPVAYRLYKPVVLDTAKAAAYFNMSFKRDPWGSYYRMLNILQ